MQILTVLVCLWVSMLLAYADLMSDTVTLDKLCYKRPGEITASNQRGPALTLKCAYAIRGYSKSVSETRLRYPESNTKWTVLDAKMTFINSAAAKPQRPESAAADCISVLLLTFV